MTSLWQFDFYYSAPFWAALLFVICLVRIFGSNSKVRRVLLFLSSNALLLAIPNFRVRDLLLVWIITAVSFSFNRILGLPAVIADQRKRLWIAVVGVVAVLAFLTFFKYHFIQDFVLRRGTSSPGKPTDLIFLIGVSYFTFKMIHVLLESYKGSIAKLEILDYFNYVTFFPAFLCGPISRYNHFASQFNSNGTGSFLSDAKLGGERIIHGLFKKLVLIQLLQPYVLPSQSDVLAALSPVRIVTGLYAAALFAYFDFSAYSDLAIGSARMIGVELPENFNNPFLQKNIREFWTNWHMSLTSWLVDYIYWPIVRKLRNLEFFRLHPVTLSIVGMNVTFLACGMWHGEDPHFILWGVYHGLGISALNIYQRQKRRIRSQFVQRYFRSKVSLMVGSFATFSYFAFGLTLFVLDLEKLRILWSAMFR